MSPSARTQPELALSSASIAPPSHEQVSRLRKNTHLRGSQATAELEIHFLGMLQPLHIPPSSSFAILFQGKQNLTETKTKSSEK